MSRIRTHSSTHWVKQRKHAHRPTAPPVVPDAPVRMGGAPELNDENRWDFSDDDEPSRLILPNQLVPKGELFNLALRCQMNLWHTEILDLEEARQQDRASDTHLSNMQAFLRTSQTRAGPGGRSPWNSH